MCLVDCKYFSVPLFLILYATYTQETVLFLARITKIKLSFIFTYFDMVSNNLTSNLCFCVTSDSHLPNSMFEPSSMQLRLFSGKIPVPSSVLAQFATFSTIDRKDPNVSEVDLSWDCSRRENVWYSLKRPPTIWKDTNGNQKCLFQTQSFISESLKQQWVDFLFLCNVQESCKIISPKMFLPSLKLIPNFKISTPNFVWFGSAVTWMKVSIFLCKYLEIVRIKVVPEN